MAERDRYDNFEGVVGKSPISASTRIKFTEHQYQIRNRSKSKQFRPQRERPLNVSVGKDLHMVISQDSQMRERSVSKSPMLQDNVQTAVLRKEKAADDDQLIGKPKQILSRQQRHKPTLKNSPLKKEEIELYATVQIQGPTSTDEERS